MATHNQVRVIGFLLSDPVIRGEPGAYTAIFKIRTTHRKTEDFYENRNFEDILVFYDDNSDHILMNRIISLVKFDLVDIKGVFNIMTVNKRSKCEHCGAVNVKEKAAATFVYPISLMKRGNLKNEKDYRDSLPEEVLRKHFEEISNEALIIGNVVNTPELLGTEARPCCRYGLGVDRKYYIRTQGTITSDYPWVYSFGKQALMDHEHLKEKALILVDGFLRNREIKNKMVCNTCQQVYTFDDVAMEFVPYSVEYLNGYYTDLDLAKMKTENKRTDADYIRHNLGL